MGMSELLEIKAVFEAIKKTSGFSAKDLRHCSMCDPISLGKHTRFIKRVPLRIQINSKDYVDLNHVRSSANESHLSTAKINNGLAEFQLWYEDKTLTFWQWVGNLRDYQIPRYSHFVHKNDLWQYYRIIKQIAREANLVQVESPILPPAMKSDIYKNSVGFLLKGKEEKARYDKYKIPYKRGLLFCGSAGCGKTLTCKWLRSLCLQNGLSWRTVTIASYRDAQQHGDVRQLFRTTKAGIIAFDDMDVIVESRKKGNTSDDLNAFLSEIDGVDPVEGVVYIFTTNYQKELDEAFVRPGRIDLFQPFLPPTRKLRRVFVESRFSPDLLEAIDTEDFITRTNESTFAEIEELRKLFCLDLIDDKSIDMDRTFKTFDKHRRMFDEQQNSIGFNSLNDDDDFDDDEFGDVDFASGPGFPSPARYS